MWDGKSSSNHDSDQPRPIVRLIVRAFPAVVDDAWTALVVACAVWLTTLVVPWAMATRAGADAARAQIAASEDRAYCEKWGIDPGSGHHAVCAHDLDRIRAAEQAQALRWFVF